MQAVRTMSAGLLAGLLVAGLAACGDDDKSSTSSSSASTAETSSAAPAPEDVRASDADVAAGLADIKTFAQDIATYVTSDHQRAVDQEEKIEPAWYRIEGTIKTNDQEAYLTFEDQFAVLANAVENSDKAKADSASARVVQAADEYLAKHPGSGSASPAPSSSSSSDSSSSDSSSPSDSSADESSSPSPTAS
jgi:hypothetical protein